MISKKKILKKKKVRQTGLSRAGDLIERETRHGQFRSFFWKSFLPCHWMSNQIFCEVIENSNFSKQNIIYYYYHINCVVY